MGENNVDGQTFEGSPSSGGGGNVTGSGATSQVAFWSGTNSLVGSGDFLYTGDALLLNPRQSFSKGLVIGSGNAFGSAQFFNAVSSSSLTTNDQVIIGNDGSQAVPSGFSSIWQYQPLNDDFALSFFGGSTYNPTGSGTAPIGAQVWIDSLALIGSQTGTILEASNLYIGAAPTVGTQANYSIHCLGNTLVGNGSMPSGVDAHLQNIWASGGSNADQQILFYSAGTLSLNISYNAIYNTFIDTVVYTGSGTISGEMTNLYVGANPTSGNVNYALHVVGDTLEDTHLLFSPSASNFTSGVFGIASTLLGNEIHSSDVTDGIYITGDSSGATIQLLNIKLESFGSPRQTIALPTDANGLFFNTPLSDSGNHDYQFLMAGLSLFKIEATGNGSGSLSASTATLSASGVPMSFNMVGAGSANLFTFDGVNNKIVLGSSVPSAGNIFCNIAGINPTTPINAFEYIYLNTFPTITTPASGTNANLYGTQLAALSYTSGGATITNAYSVYISGAPTKAGGSGPAATNVWAAYIDGTIGDNSLFIAGNARIDDGTFTHQWSPTAVSGTHTSNLFTLVTSGTPSGYILEANSFTILNSISTNTFFYGTNNILTIDTTAAMSGRVTAFNSSIDASGSTGTLSSVKAFNSFGIIGGSGRITNAYYFYAANGAGIGTQYGHYVENLTGGTTNYGLYIAGASTRAILVASGVSEFSNTSSQASAAGLQCSNIISSASTITLSGSTGITAPQGSVFINQVTYTNASTVFISDAASLYIAGAPIGSGSAIISHGYSIWAAGGLARFDAGVDVSQVPNTDTSFYATTSSTTPAAPLVVVGWIQMEVDGVKSWFPYSR